MTKKKQLAGVILAGGESRRFGEPKAFVQYKGRRFYEYSLEALAPFAERTVIISHPSLVSLFRLEQPAAVIEDSPPFRGKGPLAGLYSAMTQLAAEWYIVLPCDMPLINERVIGALVAAAEEPYDAVIPYIDGREQPLAAVYHQRVLPILAAQLIKGNFRMTALLDCIKKRRVTEADLPFAEQWFKNINTKDAYHQLFADES